MLRSGRPRSITRQISRLRAPSRLHVRCAFQTSSAPASSTSRPTVAVIKAFPSPFVAPVSTHADLSRLLSPSLDFHPSSFWTDVNDAAGISSGGEKGGTEPFQALLDFGSSHVTKPQQLWTAVDDTGCAFVMFVTSVTATGPHCGQPPTGQPSTVHGALRLHYCSSGDGRVDAAWCFRSPTAEEGAALTTLPALPGAPGAATDAEASSKHLHGTASNHISASADTTDAFRALSAVVDDLRRQVGRLEKELESARAQPQIAPPMVVGAPQIADDVAALRAMVESQKQQIEALTGMLQTSVTSVSHLHGLLGTGGAVSASFLNAKPAVGRIAVEPRGGGVLRVLFTVASDVAADTVVRYRHMLRSHGGMSNIFDVLSDTEEAQHRALWPAFFAAKAVGKRAQFHRARLMIDGERLKDPPSTSESVSLEAVTWQVDGSYTERTVVAAEEWNDAVMSQVDGSYTERTVAAAEEWNDAVMSQASLQSLYQLADPRVEYHGGLGRAPLLGVGALGGHLADVTAAMAVGPRVVLAGAPDDNKVFLHWTQTATVRSTRTLEELSGITLLVFNEEGKVVQVFDWHTPSSVERAASFRPAAAASIEAAAAERAAAGGSGDGAKHADWFSEHSAVLSRQEQEWESF
ncbi:hypothetical protein FOA52_002776 [Chlamydomonas sp. UWO 241]|nr:hypothetical protein FOA52_002776 [Chlamydomonas sp. UWO 241]